MTHDEAPRRDEAATRAAFDRLVAAHLPHWLSTRRWFGDKGRAIEAVEVIDALHGHAEGESYFLTVTRVHFDRGEPALYFLPLATTDGAQDGDEIAAATNFGKSASLVDATGLPRFGRWLLDRFLAPDQAAGWRFTLQSDNEALARARSRPPTVMGVEQSNTSLRFDDALIIKLFRRLQPGPNPDEEILRALATSNFAQAPAFVGSASWQLPDGIDFPIALIQEYVPNRGDGWRWMLERIASVAKSGESNDGFAPERLLGRRTAELHMALSDAPGSDFAPEAMSAAAIEAQIAQSTRAARAAAALLVANQNALAAPIQAALPSILAELEDPGACIAGFESEIGSRRARVHGDFHLGQTLRTLDDDWVIIDFEGEPARPVSERRQKVSVLKDVAGMLRSFAYARGAVEQHVRSTRSRAFVALWERGARQEFIVGYRDMLRQAGSRLVPDDDTAFAEATNAWEFDKAVYEIAYEARNRPDWLEIPLRSLFPAQFA